MRQMRPLCEKREGSTAFPPKAGKQDFVSNSILFPMGRISAANTH